MPKKRNPGGCKCCGVKAGCCANALDPVIPLVDSKYGLTTNLVWNGLTGASAHWIGCNTVPYAGSGSCAALSVVVQYDFSCQSTPRLVVNWQNSGSPNFCPTSGGTCGTGNVSIILPSPGGFYNLISWHCPSAPSTAFQAIFQFLGGLWPGGTFLTLG